MGDVDTTLFLFAIAQAMTHKIAGNGDEASAWMAEACRLVGCSDIVNVRGRELRRDFHAGPRDVVMEAHF